MIKINNVELPDPSTYSVGIQDINKVDRNVIGYLIGDRIATKRKLELSWSFLSNNQMSTLLNLVSQLFFTVEYIDPQDGVKTGTFYCGDRTIGALSYMNGQMNWKDAKFNIVER